MDWWTIIVKQKNRLLDLLGQGNVFLGMPEV